MRSSPLLALCLLALTLLGASPIKADEQVLFFPTIARVLPGGGAQVQVHGWIFEPQEAPPQSPSSVPWLPDCQWKQAPCEHFLERTRSFFVDNERGKRIAVQLGGRQVSLPRSEPNGHFRGQVVLSAEELARARQPQAPSLSFQAVRSSDKTAFPGEALLVEPQGLSVVSDLDDTIKVSQVRQKCELMRRTFCQPFEPVEGMAGLYRAWAERHGARFHYVSGSPWQLYPAIADFIRTQGFPFGTWHLKTFRVWDSSALDLLGSQVQYKLGHIRPLMESFPQRRFVLVGDSGEQDPEVYGELARLKGAQVVHIFIRDVTGEPRGAERYQKAFRDLPESIWTLFTQTKELQAVSLP
jgi:phosphatidate phosphatase APP1